MQTSPPTVEKYGVALASKVIGESVINCQNEDIGKRWGIRLTQVTPRGWGQDAPSGALPPTILWRGVGAVPAACASSR